MAAHVVLLFLLFCQGERSGISDAAGLSEEDEDLQVISSKKQQGLPHLESINILLEKSDKLGSHFEDPESGREALSDVDYERNYTKNKTIKETYKFGHPEVSSKIFRSPEPTFNRKKRSSFANTVAKTVINNHILASRSEKASTVQPVENMDYSVGDRQPGSNHGATKWVRESEHRQPEPHMLKEEPRRRRRRSWLWNQFFVIEEYRGPEPVLIGRVSCCFSQSVFTCETLAFNVMKLYPEGRKHFTGIFLQRKYNHANSNLIKANTLFPCVGVRKLNCCFFKQMFCLVQN